MRGYEHAVAWHRVSVQRRASIHPRIAAVVMVGAALVGSGCADPVKTAARGARELERHQQDALLDVQPIGLVAVSSTATAAYVDNVFGLRLAVPTTFTRSFNRSLSNASTSLGDLLPAFDAALKAAGATLLATHCLISVPMMEQIYGAVSLGDPVRITVSVHVSDTTAPISYQLAVTDAMPGRTSGLRNCLDLRLAPGAYLSPWASTPRTSAEVCALVPATVWRELLGTDSTKPSSTCTITGKRAGHKVWVQLVDQRSVSLAHLLDTAPADTDPNALRIESSIGDTTYIVLPRLRIGAVRVDSNDRAVAGLVADRLVVMDTSIGA